MRVFFAQKNGEYSLVPIESFYAKTSSDKWIIERQSEMNSCHFSKLRSSVIGKSKGMILKLRYISNIFFYFFYFPFSINNQSNYRLRK